MENKSKLKYYLENVKEFKLGKRKKYMDHLSRKEIQVIIQARGRMLSTKGNYKGMYKEDLKCRFCGNKEESQTHVLEECNQIDRHEYGIIKREVIFTEDITILRKAAETLEKYELKLKG